MLFQELVHLRDPEPHGAALNMAIDEILLQTATKPLLRIYRWARPSVSFGYFGRVEEVEAVWPERELVRRWTGGGVVPHGADFTYTLIVPHGVAFAQETPLASYAAVHEVVARLLAKYARASAHLAGSAAPKVSDACFANPVQHDVLIGTEKVAGAAQRRTRHGLLHQGSIQLADLPSDTAEELARLFAAQVEEIGLTAEDQAAAQTLAAEKYASDAWNRRV